MTSKMLEESLDVGFQLLSKTGIVYEICGGHVQNPMLEHSADRVLEECIFTFGLTFDVT